MGVHLVMGATFNEDRGASKENRWCISLNRRAHRIFEREGEHDLQTGALHDEGSQAPAEKFSNAIIFRLT